MSITSGETCLPSSTTRSRLERTVRMNASSSRLALSAVGSSRRMIRAFRCGSSWTKYSTRARARPWTRILMRLSGSLIIRMIPATVPTS